MLDPEDPDSPHLEGVQPTWGDLPYGCELLRSLWEADQPVEETLEEVRSAGKQNKTDQLISLFGPRKLGLLDANSSLTADGIWLAANYATPDQRRLQEDSTIGVKDTLSSTEQALFGMRLFRLDWLPMLATLHLLATESIETKETKTRAEDFRRRVSHLSGYQQVNSINSWKKKVQAHLDWMGHLDLSYVDSHGTFDLTRFGYQLHSGLQGQYPTDWS
jgi:hypothetical protein